MFGLKHAPATTLILIAIAIMFLVELATGAVYDTAAITSLGAIIPGTLENHEYWRLVAAMFLHGGWVHVAVNSWALYQLATLYENMFGTGRFLFMYFATGVIASISSALHVQGPSVGASGAIFGILGAFIFSILRSPQWRHEKWTRSLIGQLVFMGIVNIAIGLRVPIIDNWAHLGGLAAGLVLGFLPHRVPPPPPSRQVIEVRPYHGSE